MQTILGAGGAIGLELARSLTQFTPHIRLVGRNPRLVNDTDTLFPADLTQAESIAKAVEGSEVVYLTVGFDYSVKVWQASWPPLVRNVIEACLRHQAKLVFFDNVYMLDANHMHHITEDTPINPSSRKGQVRAEVDRMILDAVERRGLQAIIARAPDFYSDQKAKSVVMAMMYDNLVKGKAPQWLCSKTHIHSSGYAPELAWGTALLGNTPDAYNQVWNLPVDPTPITPEGWARLFVEGLKLPPEKAKVQVLPAWGIRLLGLFVPFMGEFYEMRYQYDRDYFFDSSKFNTRFHHTPITNAAGVAETLKRLGHG